jgi:hypothetical protein
MPGTIKTEKVRIGRGAQPLGSAGPKTGRTPTPRTGERKQ